MPHSPHKEISPELFLHADQNPSSGASGLVSFRGSEEDIPDDSTSLAASGMEDWSDSLNDPDPLPCKDLSDARVWMDIKDADKDSCLPQLPRVSHRPL